jgi:galactokinase
MVRTPSPVWSEAARDIEIRVITGFREKFGREGARVARAPGRLTFLGEHVDYNDGYVLPAAIHRATCVALAPATVEQNTVWALDFGEQATFDLRTVDQKRAADGLPLQAWAT